MTVRARGRAERWNMLFSVKDFASRICSSVSVSSGTLRIKAITRAREYITNPTKKTAS